MADNNTQAQARAKFPDGWQIRDFNPNDHMMQLNRRDYMNVQARLLWFIRDQRELVVRGLATHSYVVKTDLVEMDREHGYAHFMTYVRDVLGNEATMFGSETAKDFGDYAEKASTKSLGRALLALGYGTAFAPEMDEGDRVVDTPVERRHQHQQQHAPSRDVPRKLPAKMAPFPQAVAVVNPADEPAVTFEVEDNSYDPDPAPNEGSLTLADFLKTCRQELDLAPPQVMAKLGVKSLTGLNLDQALAKVRADLRQLATGTSRP